LAGEELLAWLVPDFTETARQKVYTLDFTKNEKKSRGFTKKKKKTPKKISMFTNK
jgi:hypothetical protein